MAAAVAVPLITSGISMASAYFASRKSKAEKSAQGAQAGALNQLTAQGGQNFGAGFPAMKQALGYYSTLLQGNRAQMAQAGAGPTAQITDLYRGAESNLERQGVRGGSRDLAVAELGRDRTSELARLTTGMQPMAAGNLGQLGSAATGMASGSLATAAGGYGNMAGQAMQDRQYRNAAYGQAADSSGQAIYNMMKGKSSGGQPNIAQGGMAGPAMNMQMGMSGGLRR